MPSPTPLLIRRLAPAPQFFSLDVQGAELMVLSSVDWRALSVSVLVTECKALFCRDTQDEEVHRLLTAVAGLQWAGIFRARHDVWDSVYVNASMVQGFSTRESL